MLKRTLKRLLLSTFSLALLSQTALAQSDPFARDLVQMSQWFEGVFDNDSQIWFEQDRRWQGKDADKHRRNNSKHVRLDVPQIGKHVFYVEEFMDNDPSNVWRQRIVSLESAPPKGIKMKLFFPNRWKEMLGKNAEQIAELIDLDNLNHSESCDVWFKRDGDQFKGQMDEQECEFGEGEKRRYSVHNLTLSENKYWRIDKTFLFSNGELHQGEQSDEPSKMRRAQIYECKVSMPFISYAEPHENDVSLDGLMIHDQGGSAIFTNPRTNTEFELQLREKEYPYYEEGSDFFLMRLKEVGAKYSSALVTTGPNPEKLSVNLGNMAASCNLSG